MSADPLVIDGMRAVELARLTQGLPGWPGLHRHNSVAGWLPVSLAAAENDLAAGWGVDCYAYPVPRERVEAELAEHEAAAVGRVTVEAMAWWDTVRSALRGSDDAIHTVACALARRDRDEMRAD